MLHVPNKTRGVVMILLLALSLVSLSPAAASSNEGRPLEKSHHLRYAPGFTAPVEPPSGSARPVVHLTFDDGPQPQWTPQILAVLARYHARATFFVLGQQAQRYPGLIQAIVSGGHTVANHTFSHASLRGIGRDLFVSEVQRTQVVLRGIGTACLRPPYGAIDGAGRGYAAELGYRIVLWDVDPRDWTRPGSALIAAHVLQRVRPGSIVLLHDGGGSRAQTVAALDTILRQLTARGYSFAPVCP